MDLVPTPPEEADAGATGLVVSERQPGSAVSVDHTSAALELLGDAAGFRGSSTQKETAASSPLLPDTERFAAGRGRVGDVMPDFGRSSWDDGEDNTPGAPHAQASNKNVRASELFHSLCTLLSNADCVALWISLSFRVCHFGDRFVRFFFCEGQPAGWSAGTRVDGCGGLVVVVVVVVCLFV